MSSPPTELVARNPARDVELARIPTTAPEEVWPLVGRARLAQRDWDREGWPRRREFLDRWHDVLARRADEIAKTVRDEVGKPFGEALGAEVLATLDQIRWTARNSRRLLSSSTSKPHWQRLMLMPSARVRWRPIGVVGIVGAWNYPILLNAPLIAQALAAGNGVVWKPSEFASLSGRLLQETLEEAGVPEGLVAIAQGGAEVGRALAEGGVDKLWYTGGIAGGRAVLGALGAMGVPAVAELSGFDPAIVRADAPMGRTCDALAWSAFVNTGQACMAVKRVHVVGDARPWAEELAARARKLRVGDPGASSEIDVGPMISTAARDRFHQQVRAAVDAGAQVLVGGEPAPGPGSFYPPTVLLATSLSQVFSLEGCFGPVVVVHGVGSDDEAVEAANGGQYGLSASVWGADRKGARAVAERLVAGMVGVNEAVTFFAHLTAPAGGVRASGFGRVHGRHGLLEFATPTAMVERSSRAIRPQIFPYTSTIERACRIYLRLIHGASGSGKS